MNNKLLLTILLIGLEEKKTVSLNVKEFYGWFRYKEVFSGLKTVGTHVHAA